MYFEIYNKYNISSIIQISVQEIYLTAGVIRYVHVFIFKFLLTQISILIDE